MTLVVVRSTSPARRCVGCHDDLSPGDERWTCGGCGTALHQACLAGLRRCPTLGCRRALRSASGSATTTPLARPTRSDRLVQVLVFAAPALLAALSPVIAGVGTTLLVRAGDAPLLSAFSSAVPLLWIFAVALPFLVGQGLVAPMARDRGLPGDHDARVRVGAVAGFSLSGVVIAVLVMKALANLLV